MNNWRRASDPPETPCTVLLSLENDATHSSIYRVGWFGSDGYKLEGYPDRDFIPDGYGVTHWCHFDRLVTTPEQFRERSS